MKSFNSVLVGIAFVISGVVSQSDILLKQTQKHITTTVGEEADLLCSAPAGFQVRSCSFTNLDTNQRWQVWAGASFEDGRVESDANLSPNDCGLRFNNVVESDNGIWQCDVAGNDQDKNSKSGSGKVELTVAVAPQEIRLYVDDVESYNDNLEIRLNEDSSARKIKCEAIGARPRPEFIWKIGDTVMNGDKTDLDEPSTKTYSEIFTYYPAEKHNGKKLTCELNHEAYTLAQKDAQENIKSLNFNLRYKPKEKTKPVEFYIQEAGETKEVRIKFEAYPKPTKVEWFMDGQETPLTSGDSQLDGKYTAGTELSDGDLIGEYIATLTISDVTKDDTDKTHRLLVSNDEGPTEYEFILRFGAQPPADGDSPTVARSGDGEPMNSGPVIGIVIVIVIIVLLIGVAVIARSKGLLCFAGNKTAKSEDTEAAVDKEGSDTESAEHPDETATAKETPSRKSKTSMKNIFAAVKKSVTPTKKDKYSSNEPNESELKVALQDGEEKKDAEKDDVTYADLDKTALSTGNRNPALEEEKTEYAEIQHKEDKK